MICRNLLLVPSAITSIPSMIRMPLRTNAIWLEVHDLERHLRDFQCEATAFFTAALRFCNRS
jgi:hypothetical protein